MSRKPPPLPAAAGFARRVIAWQLRHGRRDLPWQHPRDAYRIWVSEVMLQQTQVATVIPYFERFVARFPEVASLAAASADEVMRLWSGLGYYARARNLHRAAGLVVERHGGEFPPSIGDVRALPGIGRSTAAAIVALATGEPHAILDGNVKRVLARHYAVGGAADSAATVKALWAIAERLLPPRGVAAYTQGLMDLGATVCTRSRPDCARCPLRATCVARREGRTDEFPGRKAARAARERAISMLVVVSPAGVLVERRPSAGIWGGLWSLPEAPADADAGAWAKATHGLRASSAEALEPFSHAFTHFTLRVTPWLVRLEGAAPVAREGQMAWLALPEAAAAALPAPVKKLLASLPAGAASRAGPVRAGSGAGSRASRRGR